MIKVYFESTAHAELAAVFRDDNLYMKCLPALEAQAKSERMIVTESDQPIEIDRAVPDDSEAQGFSCLKWSHNDFDNSEQRMNDFFKTRNEQIIEFINELIEIHKLEWDQIQEK